MGSVELKYDFEREQAVNQIGLKSPYEAALIEIADGTIEDMYLPMCELLESACGYPSGVADDISTFIMKDMPFAGPQSTAYVSLKRLSRPPNSVSNSYCGSQLLLRHPRMLRLTPILA